MPAITAAQLDGAIKSFDWEGWTPDLTAIVEPAFREVALDQGAREAEAHGYPFNERDPFMTRHFTTYLAARITQLDETTREVVADELRRSLEDDTVDSVQDLAGRLSEVTLESAAFSPARALMIARTETAIAYNTGALAAYRQGGVENVEVSDGDGDEECAEADGETWTLEEALADPIAHPNCTRAFAPVVEDVE